MATGQNINTYFQGTWHKGNAAVISAADHGAWLGSNVFDGARYFNGVAPDPSKAAPNHSPYFFADERNLKYGTKALTQLAVDYLYLYK